MATGLEVLSKFLMKAEMASKPLQQGKQPEAQPPKSPGASKYTYGQPEQPQQPIGQTDTGQPIHEVERGPHSVQNFGDVMVAKTTPGHEASAPKHLEHDGKHWIRAGHDQQSGTIGYHEYQPSRHVMDPATGFAKEGVPVEAKGVAGGLVHLAGLPESAGGDLPAEINDPHHGHLVVRGFNADSGMTTYHKDVHNPGWNKPGSTGEAKANAQPQIGQQPTGPTPNGLPSGSQSPVNSNPVGNSKPGLNPTPQGAGAPPTLSGSTTTGSPRTRSTQR